MKRQLSLGANRLIVATLFSLIATSGWAQRISAITFDKLPQDYQLYPRNAQSEAQIPISGRVDQADWKYVSVQLFRNKQAIGYKRAAISYAGSEGRFTVDPFTIRAEKAEYDIKLHLVKDADSVNIVNRSNIVAGDVYVFTGQSNASAFFRETRTNEFCRTFGKISGTYGTEPYNAADTTWALSNQESPVQDVGTFGYEFQQYILSAYGIPTCLINGAVHWSMMAHHATRTASNPADLNTGYGRILYRLQKAGVDKAVKALVYRQGESEAYGEGNSWGENFDIYYRNLKMDLPSIRQLYVFQVDVIEAGVAAAPRVREAQRALASKYSDIQVLPSIGTAGFDGLHYSDEGYTQNALELGRLVGRDLYNSTDTDNISAPNIQRAFYSTQDRSEITLLFNDGQEVSWTDEYRSFRMKDFFYIDGREGEVISGRAAGNRVVLTLKNPSTATKLTYLPTALVGGGYVYNGPYITNKRGMRALSFYEFPIGDPVIPLTTPVLTVGVLSESALQLSWNAVANATSYLLEVKDTQSGTVKLLKQLPAGTLTYLADGLTRNTTYTLRLKALGNNTESAWYQLDGKTAATLSTPVVQAKATFATIIAVSWQPVTDALGYVVERRSATETDYTSVATLSGSVLSYTDNTVKDNSEYTYRIRATGQYADSPAATVSAQTPAFLSAPEMVVSVLYNNALNVSWKAIPNATSYQVDRKVPGEEFKTVGTFLATTTSIKDTDLLIGSTYTYRIKAYGDRTESPFASSSATTPSLLDMPTVSLTVVYNNSLQVKWSSVANAASYQLERKASDQEYQKVGTFESGVLTFTDTNLLPGTLYSYRLKAVSPYSESPFVRVDAQTPGLLPAPTMSLTVVYNNALTVNWTAVANATAYQIERQAPGQEYKQVALLKQPAVTFGDTNLTPGTVYVYRIRAMGDKTESTPVSASIVTPSLLDTPDLLVTPISFDTLSLSWKPTPNATHYLMERRVAGTITYQGAVRIDATKSQYVDSRLLPSTQYQYRLTAYGDKTQSNPALASGTTLVLLAVNQDPAVIMSLLPNPASGGQTSLRFSGPVSGTLQVVDLRGVVQLEQEVVNATQIPLSLAGYAPGVYLIRVRRATDVIVQKLLIH